MIRPPYYNEPQEILHFYSNVDWFWVCNLVKTKLEETDIIVYEGKKLLKFSAENQNNLDLAVLLNGSNDPEVYYSNYKNKKWIPHISSFSEFV
jgi:hypothetical protein